LTEPCPLCRSPRTRVSYQLTGYRIVVCDDCGFEFHDGFTGGGGAGDLFSAEYYTERHGTAFGSQLAGDYARDPSAPVYARWLDVIAARSGPGRILDVGSALGTFLAMAASRSASSRRRSRVTDVAWTFLPATSSTWWPMTARSTSSRSGTRWST
jgi:hypothetical protein